MPEEYTRNDALYDEWLERVRERALDALVIAFPTKTREELDDDLSNDEHEEFLEQAKEKLREEAEAEEYAEEVRNEYFWGRFQ